MRNLVLAASLTLLASQSAVADEWMVEAHYPDRAALIRATAHFQHAIVDANRQVLRVDTDERGIELLEQAGLAVSIDSAGTAQLRGFYAKMRDAVQSGLPQITKAGYPSIPGYACYRTVEGAYQTMDDLQAGYPALAEIHEIGPSWQKARGNGGYEMRALRITNLATAAADPDRAKFVAFGSIHAREYTPAELLTRFAEWLVKEYGRDAQATWLVDNVDFRLILMANPDGRKKAETGLSWRKNTNNVDGYCAQSSSVGIDLNRNFPFHWNTTGGEGSSGIPCDATFRGPGAGSEPETQNLVAYVAGTQSLGSYVGGALPDRRNGDFTGAVPEDYRGLFFDIHSYSQLVLWSWGDTYAPAPNDPSLRTLGRRLAWFNGYTPQASVELYPTDGTTDDTFYGMIGAPAYTIELGIDFFESCASFEASTFPINFDALKYAARAAHAPYQLPWGPDAIDILLKPDLVAPDESFRVDAHLDGGRFNDSNGVQERRPVGGAVASLKLPPWAAGIAPVTLTAQDGTFDEVTEIASGALSSTGLAVGHHLVFAQGSDDLARAGTADAAFLEIAPAESIAGLAGDVTRISDGAPVLATLTMRESITGSERRTTSEPDGGYVLRNKGGTVDVRVSAPGYLIEEATNLVLTPGETLRRDFRLYSECVVFEDDVEDGGAAWTAQSPWIIDDAIPGHPGHAWNTPNYGNNLNRALTLASSLDLGGYEQLALEFDDRCATEGGWDFGYVEYSIDGGTTWTSAYTCSGRQGWQHNRIELPAEVEGGHAFRFRFRLKSDPYVNGAGWAVDNVRLSAGGQACRDGQVPAELPIFANGFE